MLEGEQEEQEIENLFENIMENFPNLEKEIDFQEVQEAQRVPKRTQRGTHQGTSSLSYPILKTKKILKAGRGKERVTYKGVPIRLSADFSKETLQSRRAGKKYLKS